MDIRTLVAEVYEDLEPQVTSARLSEDGGMVFTLECDDWEGSSKRRKIELHCAGVRESNISLGILGGIDFVEDHPVLFEYTGDQGALYFSSKPESAEQVFYLAHDLLYGAFQGWVDPSEILHGSPREIYENLAGGFGLLARGPISLLERLAQNLTPLLNVNVVKTHVVQEQWKALIVGGERAICKSIRVVEHESND